MISQVIRFSTVVLSAGFLWAGAAEIPGAHHFETNGLVVSSEFEGGRLADFSGNDDGSFTAKVSPEREPMNNQQAWYAFRIESKVARRVTIRFSYTDQKTHLFDPKISRDRVNWERAENFRVKEDGTDAVLELAAGPEVVWVAAQELFTEQDFTAWIGKLAEKPFVRVGEIGKSTRGRAIRKVEFTEAAEDAPLVIVLGRQHPPEVTGTLGLKAFVERVAGSDELAVNFRKQFRVLIVPLANPDGVNGGHWRYNVNGVDLNRDWGTFEQAETRVIRDEFLRAKSQARGNVPFFIDFHSTLKDVRYVSPVVTTKTPDEKLEGPDRLMRRWLARVKKIAPEPVIPVEVSDASKERKLNAISWMRKAGSAAVTHEFAHTTDRAVIREVAEADAVALMELLTTTTGK